jgi:hypothetical protein
VAAPTPSVFAVSNTACAAFDGNNTSDCDTENITFDSALGLALSPNGALSTSPGQNAVYTHTLSNSGNQTERYIIDFPGGNRGWTQQLNILDGGTLLTTLTPGGSYTLTIGQALASGESLTLQHIITVANGASNGDIDTSLISATSFTDPSLNRTVTDVTNVGAGCIQGVLFYDANNNGTREATEPVYPGTTVIVRDAGYNGVAQLVTDANGAYSLANLPAAQYNLEIDARFPELGRRHVRALGHSRNSRGRRGRRQHDVQDPV